jgi:RNA polymerase sigma-70 factor, ECF subfamily
MEELSLPCSDVATASSRERTQPELTALLGEHFPLVWRLLRRWGLSPADADDAAQQVFVIASRKLHRVETERARSFLYGIALRVGRNARRGIERRREVLGDPAETPGPEARGPEQLTEFAEACTLLDELLAQLPDDLRRVLILADIEELQVQEVAALEHIPIGTAASRLRRARAGFRDLLAKVGNRNPFGSEP